jgi:IMP dehydrogenase
MDGVVGPAWRVEMGRHGGLAVLNLEGIFSRYENPNDVLERIVSASQEEATKIIQSIYGEPIKEELIHQRIQEIKKGGGPAVVSSIPSAPSASPDRAGSRRRHLRRAVDRHHRPPHRDRVHAVDLRKLKKQLAIPLVIGNVVTYEACLELMDVGATRC